MVDRVARSSARDAVDLVVVGAGIVGLAHAVAAIERGLSVTVLERDERAVGASIRNFGHCCVTGQVGEAAVFAERARSSWLRLSAAAGFWAGETGSLVVARAAEEMACLAELAAVRGRDEVVTLTADQVRERIRVSEVDLLGGAFLPRDIRVDPRTAASAIAAWVDRQPGARVLWSTPALRVGPGSVRTSAGRVTGKRVVVCVGHDLDRLYPEVAEKAGLSRCVLQMLQVSVPGGISMDPALLTGSSLLRYPAFAGTHGAVELRRRWTSERPDLLSAGINHMITQRPGGDLIVGDTHRYARNADPTHPAESERLDELLLAETRELLGVPGLRAVHRWRGVDASAETEFLRAGVGDGVVGVVVTTGIGMTTAFGLAASVLDSWDR